MGYGFRGSRLRVWIDGFFMGGGGECQLQRAYARVYRMLGQIACFELHGLPPVFSRYL